MLAESVKDAGGSQARSPVPATLRFNGIQRILLLASAFCVLALLATAAFLRPAPAGLGTHQQLGLPPCTSIVLWGIRCPSCGMTTSWAYLLRGELTAAMNANIGGTFLALIALAYIPVSCYFSILGRSSRRGWLSSTLAVGLLGSLACATTQWLIGLL